MTTEFVFEEVSEVADINIGIKGNKLADKNDMIALIDADTVIFGACSALEEQEEILSESFYTKEEYEAILNSPYFDKENFILYNYNIENLVNAVKDKVKTIMDNTGCKDYELHLTNGRKSFRYKLIDTYKATRTGRAPAGLMELKEWLVTNDKDRCFMHTDFEADDIVVALKKEFKDKYMLCAVDKDVLFTLPGKHYNYYESTKYNILMKYVDVDETESIKHHYKQVLTGDASDNVIGLKGVGPKTADKLLANCRTHKDCWEVVVREYENKGRDIIDAVINMQLVNMHQLDLDTKEIVLWRPSI